MSENEIQHSVRRACGRLRPELKRCLEYLREGDTLLVTSSTAWRVRRRTSIASGLVATIVAGFVRNFLVTRGALGPKSTALPGTVILLAVIASIAGSAGAVEIDQASGFASPVWIGALAGLFSAILMALLMITYSMPPDQGRL